jgi:hypothetical protein
MVVEVWNGQRDRYVQADLRHRAIIKVNFYDPLRFLTDVSLVRRPLIRRIMDCALEVIEYFVDWSDVIVMASPALDILAVNVLKKLPDEVGLLTAYASWWGHEKDRLKIIYEL